MVPTDYIFLYFLSHKKFYAYIAAVHEQELQVDCTVKTEQGEIEQGSGCDSQNHKLF